MYIEFVIADNFLLTVLAGATATALCHKRIDIWRLLSAATVGTVVAVFYPYMRLGTAAQLAVKTALWIALCMIMFLKTRRIVLSSLLFLGSTFTYGGACYALGLIIYGDSSMAYSFSCKYPLFLVLGTGACVFFAARYAVRRLRIPRAREPYEYRTEVEIFGKTLNFYAFLDTGNCVFDDATGLPVIVTDPDRFTSKLDTEGAREFMKSLSKFRTIEVKTPAGKAKAYLVKPAGVTVYSAGEKHKIDAMVGLVGGGGFSAAHEMLLNPVCVAEGV